MRGQVAAVRVMLSVQVGSGPVTGAGQVEIPVMADADTGYGNSINAMYVTREFIRAGAAGA